VEDVFTYSSLPMRPPGTGMRVLAKALKGVRSTLTDVEPFARAWQEHNAYAARESGPLWVVLGDSMAQGIGASAFDRGWPGQLAAQIDPALRMVNLSFHGARVRDVLDTQWPAARLLGEPALVTVLIGSNDVVWRRYRAELPEAFEQMLAVLPEGAVVANLPNPHKAARAVDRMLRDSDRIVTADLRREGPRAWRGKLAPDHFHPNDRGYAEMTAVLARAVNR
jgi:lysophospholipase L1-like esterase